MRSRSLWRSWAAAASPARAGCRPSPGGERQPFAHALAHPRALLGRRAAPALAQLLTQLAALRRRRLLPALAQRFAIREEIRARRLRSRSHPRPARERRAVPRMMTSPAGRARRRRRGNGRRRGAASRQLRSSSATNASISSRLAGIGRIPPRCRARARPRAPGGKRRRSPGRRRPPERRAAHSSLLRTPSGPGVVSGARGRPAGEIQRERRRRRERRGSQRATRHRAPRRRSEVRARSAAGAATRERVRAARARARDPRVRSAASSARHGAHAARCARGSEASRSGTELAVEQRRQLPRGNRLALTRDRRSRLHLLRAVLDGARDALRQAPARAVHQRLHRRLRRVERVRDLGIGTGPPPRRARGAARWRLGQGAELAVDRREAGVAALRRASSLRGDPRAASA